MTDEQRTKPAAPQKTNWLKVLATGLILAYPLTYGAMWALGALPHQREATRTPQPPATQEPFNPPAGLTLEEEAAVANMCLERTVSEFGEINHWPDGTGAGKVSETLNDFGYITWVADIARIGPDGSTIEDAAIVRCDVSPDNLGTVANLEINR